MCRSIPNYCTRPASAGSEGVSHAEYLKLLRSLPFIACPHGGGVDPSPKAWEAILVGTIPIIERSIVVDAYEHLPVVIVDSWEHLFHLNDSAMEYSLTQWITSLKPYYIEGSELRNQTLEVLYHCFCMSDYLWQLLYDLIYCCFYLLICILHHVCPSPHIYLIIVSVHHFIYTSSSCLSITSCILHHHVCPSPLYVHQRLKTRYWTSLIQTKVDEYYNSLAVDVGSTLLSISNSSQTINNSSSG